MIFMQADLFEVSVKQSTRYHMSSIFHETNIHFSSMTTKTLALSFECLTRMN